MIPTVTTPAFPITESNISFGQGATSLTPDLESDTPTSTKDSQLTSAEPVNSLASSVQRLPEPTVHKKLTQCVNINHVFRFTLHGNF